MDITIIEMPETEEQFDQLIDVLSNKGYSIDDYSIYTCMSKYSRAGWLMIEDFVVRRVMGYGSMKGSSVTFTKLTSDEVFDGADPLHGL